MISARKVRNFFLLILLTLSLAFVIFKVRHFLLNQWVIDNISISGNVQYLDPKELEPVAKEFIGKSLVFADIEALHVKLLALDWVKDAEISRSWPATLDVRLHEEKPLALLRGEKIISTEGKTLKILEGREYSIPNFVVEDEYLADAFENYFDFLSKISVVGLGINKLSHNSVEGWRINVNRDFDIVVGHSNLMARLGRFVLAYHRKLESESKTFDYVDLRYTNGVAIGWKTTNNK